MCERNTKHRLIEGGQYIKLHTNIHCHTIFLRSKEKKERKRSKKNIYRTQITRNIIYNVRGTDYSMNLDNLFLFNFTIISTYFTPVDIDIVPTRFIQILGDLVSAIGNISETVSANALCPIIFFTELQTILLTIFLVIFSINLALIGFYWQKYGGVITDRFIRQSK